MPKAPGVLSWKYRPQRAKVGKPPRSCSVVWNPPQKKEVGVTRRRPFSSFIDSQFTLMTRADCIFSPAVVQGDHIMIKLVLNGILLQTIFIYDRRSFYEENCRVVRAACSDLGVFCLCRGDGGGGAEGRGAAADHQRGAGPRRQDGTSSGDPLRGGQGHDLQRGAQARGSGEGRVQDDARGDRIVGQGPPASPSTRK